MTATEESAQTTVKGRWRRWRIVVPLAMAVVGLVAAAVVVRPWSGLPKDAVFELDGRVYVESDLRRHLVEQQAMYGIEAPDLDQEDGRRLAAQSFAVSLVVDAAAEEAEVTVSQADLDRAAQEFLDAAYPGGRTEFVDALADEGVSENDVLEELERQLRIERLYSQVTADLTIEAETVRSAYEANPEDFDVPPTRRISAIAVASRSEALTLRSSLTPSNFARVARRRSLDASTAPQGGDLGFVAAGQLQGPFAEAAFRSRPGQVFGPVRSPGASYVYLGLVEAVRPARRQSFEEVREELRTTLVAARGLTTWQAFLTDAVAGADLTYAEDYRPADPSSLPGIDLPGSQPSPSIPSGPAGTER